MRIEAAAWKGRPVYFRLIGPWTSFEAEAVFLTPTMRWTRSLLVAIPLLVVAGAVVLARRNYRLGRGDMAAARRLAAVVFVASLLEWILTAHHVFIPPPTPVVAPFWGCAYALTLAVTSWVLYMAVEPFARRHRPQALITWSRLLGGDVSNPLVGAHLLAGVAYGVVVAVWFTLHGLLMRQSGAVAMALDPATLQDTAGILASLLFTLIRSIVTSLGGFVALVWIWYVVRRRWVAGIVFLLLSVLPAIATSRPVIEAAFALPTNALGLWIMVRFGVLPLIVAQFVANVLATFPITARFSAWYAEATLFALATVALLALWSFRVAVAGRRVLNDELLDMT
jgi:hypothetical protein